LQRSLADILIGNFREALAQVLFGGGHGGEKESHHEERDKGDQAQRALSAAATRCHSSRFSLSRLSLFFYAKLNYKINCEATRKRRKSKKEEKMKTVVVV
jgi:hypothetical protein